MCDNTNIFKPNGITYGLPTILYKYRDWADKNHQKILIDNTLFMSSAENFDDPFDCNLERGILTKDEFKKIDNEKIKLYHPEYNRRERREKLFENLRTSPMYIPEKREKINNDYKKNYNSHTGICSMTFDSQSDLMWKEYASDYKGICIGFNAKKICDEMRCNILKVQYFDPLPIIGFTENTSDRVDKHLTCKHSKYAYEKEFRVIKTWIDKEPTIQDRNIKLSPDCIMEVILGKNILQTHENEIRNLMAEKYPNVSIIKQK